MPRKILSIWLILSKKTSRLFLRFASMSAMKLRKSCLKDFMRRGVGSLMCRWMMWGISLCGQVRQLTISDRHPGDNRHATFGKLPHLRRRTAGRCSYTWARFARRRRDFVRWRGLRADSQGCAHRSILHPLRRCSMNSKERQTFFLDTKNTKLLSLLGVLELWRIGEILKNSKPPNLQAAKAIRQVLHG